MQKCINDTGYIPWVVQTFWTFVNMKFISFSDIEELEAVSNSSNKILMESFLTHLPHCVNREMIDSSAVEFVMNLNTKYNRKKLVK